MSTHDPVSALVRVELWQLLGQTGTSQVALAQATGFSTKHLNQMLQGKVGISADLGCQLLGALGYELVLAMRPVIAAVRSDKPAEEAPC